MDNSIISIDSIRRFIGYYRESDIVENLLNNSKCLTQILNVPLFISLLDGLEKYDNVCDSN